MTERIKPARQLADARERIVAQLDVVQQRIANLEEILRKTAAQANEARIQEGALREILAALGQAPTRGRKARTGAPTPVKPTRKIKAPAEAMLGNGQSAAERTLTAAAEAGLLPR